MYIYVGGGLLAAESLRVRVCCVGGLEALLPPAVAAAHVSSVPPPHPPAVSPAAAAAAVTRYCIAIMADTEGSELHTGELQEAIKVEVSESSVRVWGWVYGRVYAAGVLSGACGTVAVLLGAACCASCCNT